MIECNDIKQVTPNHASAKSQGVTVWYQSFDCRELGFLLKSILQSLGLSQKRFDKHVFIAYTKRPDPGNKHFYKGKGTKHDSKVAFVV